MQLAKDICFTERPCAAINHGELAGSALGGQIVPQKMKIHAASCLASGFWSTEMMGLSVPHIWEVAAGHRRAELPELGAVGRFPRRVAEYLLLVCKEMEPSIVAWVLPLLVLSLSSASVG